MKAEVHLARIGKPERVYVEQNILRDDGIILVTRSELPMVQAVEFSREWQSDGYIAEGEIVRAIEKHYFYREWFDILAFLDGDDRPLGWYCDIATPLSKIDMNYFLRDLLLDLWIWPDGRTQEMDWEEFEEACRKGLVSEDERQQAEGTLRWLVEETRRGVFPYRYLK